MGILEQALSKAMYFCSKSEKCTFDVQKKLEEWQIPKSEWEEILNRLISEGFINNDRYARFYVKDKFKLNKWGKIKIRMMLKLKNFSSDTIENALSEIDEDQYQQVLIDLLRKKFRGLKYNNEQELKFKLVRFGVSHGFESDYIVETLKRIQLPEPT